MRSDWQPEHDAALRQGVADRLSYSEIRAAINKRFGTCYTRAACIGRARRKGMVDPQRTITHLANRRTQRKPKTVASPVARNTFAPSVRPDPIPAGSVAAAIISGIRRKALDQREALDMRPLRCAEVEPLHIGLHGLNEHTCRWPCGGWPEATPITFCGHTPWPGSSYCGAHRDLSRPATNSPSLAPELAEA